MTPHLNISIIQIGYIIILTRDCANVFYVYLTDGAKMQLAASMVLEAWSKRACSLKAMPPTPLKPIGFCPIRVFICVFV